MENNNTVQNVVHGFKVFRPDWTCIQYDDSISQCNLFYSVMVL